MNTFTTAYAVALPKMVRMHGKTPTIGELKVSFGPDVDVYLHVNEARALLEALTGTLAEIDAEAALAATNSMDGA